MQIIRIHGVSVTITCSGRGYVSSSAHDERYCNYEQIPEETRCRLRTAEGYDAKEWAAEMTAAEKRLIARLRLIGRSVV